MKQEQKTDTAINTYAGWRPILKPVGRLLVAAQLALALQPLSVLAQEAGSTPYNPVAQAQIQRLAELNQTIEMAKANRGKTPADQVSDKLVKAQELVAQLRSIHTPGKPEKHQQLKALLAEINTGAADVRAEFAATRADLVKKNLPAEILARHDEAVGQFEQRAATFAQIVAAAGSDEERVTRLAEFFDKFPNKRKPGKFDPKKLPWSTPQPNKRMPAETQTAWYQNLYGDQKIRLAQAGGSIGPLQFTTMPEASQAPTTADLAETDEVQLTPEIRAKAQELGNNPVNIYNWVRNNIEWVPSAGAIQNANSTLLNRRGNATDTASLLIALLRAAKVPARYQWGTIDVDAAKAQNWIGGVNRPDVALQLLNQGGIAARGVSSAGRLASIRMEHVWVEAYVNWSPSRGSRNATKDQHPNSNAPLNAWVPLDASFKQYEYTKPLDFKSAVPLDPAALLSAVGQGSTSNTTEGWVRNHNQLELEKQRADYEERWRLYLSGRQNTDLVGDLVGKRVISAQTNALLPGTLPYQVVFTASRASAIPAAQQHRFTYRLYATAEDRAYGSTPLVEITQRTSAVEGRRLTLRYVPATQADMDLFNSYLPQPHPDGSPITPSEFPTSLPAYLLKVRPQILLDGTVLSESSQPVQMGADLYSLGGFSQLYAPSQWDLTSEESNVAGQATAIGISLQGVSPTHINKLKTTLQNTKNLLLQGATEGLTGEQVSGDFLTAVVWSWFSAAESHGRLAQGASGAIEFPGLSYGLVHAVAEPQISWGVIRKVTFPGINLDIGHVRILTWSTDDSADRWIQYNRARGEYMSALEHGIPERLFNDPSKCSADGTALPKCPQGISAVKAIAVASQQGQRIYAITRDVYAANPNIVMTQLSAHSESTRDRIQNALDAGYEVRIHQAPIFESGWSGAGFVLVDPSTGAGAYLIEGGSSGGYILLGLALGLVSGIAVVMAGPVIAALVGAIGFAIGVYYALTLDVRDLLNFTGARLLGTLAGIALAVILGGYVTISLPLLFVLGFAWLLLTVARLLLIEIITAANFLERSRPKSMLG